MGLNLLSSNIIYIGVGVAIAVLLWIVLKLAMGKIRALPSALQARKYKKRKGPLQLDKNVQFTIYWPRAIEPEKPYKLLAFAHLSERRADAPADEPDPVEEVQKQAQEGLGEHASAYNEATEDTHHAIPQEQGLTFLPKLPGLIFDPPYQVFLWYGPVHKHEFKIKASKEHDGRTITGSMRVFLGRIELAQIPISIRVDSKKADLYQTPILKVVSASPYRKIFASYSHLDSEIVKEFEDYAKALGDDYLRDVRTLRSGEEWSKRLEEMIVEANVFQLFWSSNSMHSQFVRQEWEYALKLHRPNFIRPIYWEDPLPKEPDLPPPSLLDLHFQRFPPEKTEAKAASTGPQSQPAAPSSAGGSRWSFKQGAVIVSAVAMAAVIINIIIQNRGIPSSTQVAVTRPSSPVADVSATPTSMPNSSDNSPTASSTPLMTTNTGQTGNPRSATREPRRTVPERAASEPPAVAAKRAPMMSDRTVEYSPYPTPAASPSTVSGDAGSSTMADESSGEESESAVETSATASNPSTATGNFNNTTASANPNRAISGGVLNGKALSLPPPVYPPMARAAKAGGQVTVQVMIDEDGKVISAHAIRGHPLLMAAAESAAKSARFQPTRLAGQPVKVSGILIYNFETK